MPHFSVWKSSLCLSEEGLLKPRPVAVRILRTASPCTCTTQPMWQDRVRQGMEARFGSGRGLEVAGFVVESQLLSRVEVD